MIAFLLGGGAAALSLRHESDTSVSVDRISQVNGSASLRSTNSWSKGIADDALLLKLDGVRPWIANHSGAAASGGGRSRDGDHTTFAIRTSAFENPQQLSERRADRSLPVDAAEHDTSTAQLAAPPVRHPEEPPTMPAQSLTRAGVANFEPGILELSAKTTGSLAKPAFPETSELGGTPAGLEADVRGTGGADRQYMTAVLADGVMELVAVDTPSEEMPLTPALQADLLDAAIAAVPEIEADEVAGQPVAPSSSLQDSRTRSRPAEFHSEQKNSLTEGGGEKSKSASLMSGGSLEATPFSNATADPTALGAPVVYLTGEIATRVNGEVRGSLAVRIDPNDQISVRLSDLLSLFRGAMDGDSFDRLIASSSAGKYVGLGKLRAAGFTLDFDPITEQLILGLD